MSFQAFWAWEDPTCAKTLLGPFGKPDTEFIKQTEVFRMNMPYVEKISIEVISWGRWTSAFHLGLEKIQHGTAEKAIRFAFADIQIPKRHVPADGNTIISFKISFFCWFLNWLGALVHFPKVPWNSSIHRILPEGSATSRAAAGLASTFYVMAQTKSKYSCFSVCAVEAFHWSRIMCANLIGAFHWAHFNILDLKYLRANKQCYSTL